MTKLCEDNKAALRGINMAIIHLTQQLLEIFGVGRTRGKAEAILATQGRVDSIKDLLILAEEVAENKDIRELLK